MAKELTTFEGQPSPVPIFSRELAHDALTATGWEVKVVITTAGFGAGGVLEATRSYWIVDDREKRASLSMEQPEEFNASRLEIGKAYIAGFVRQRAWREIEHNEIPATHKAILAGWLRERWDMQKLRGRIT